MRTLNTVGILLAGIGVLFCGSAVMAADGASDACALLTQAQVSTVLGVSLGAGAHPGGDSPSAQATCQWSQPGQGSVSPKRVMLVILGPMGTLSPAARFENVKRPVQGITKTPVTGLGDDALYVEARPTTSLYVKKGNSVFQIFVFGFTPDQIKTMEKTLAQQVVAKL